ncbi:VWA domain-containing protein [Hellea sp.]|nr:VWA domain-containing protein [Hellea sp.]
MEHFDVKTETLKAALPFGHKGSVDILIKVQGPDRPKKLPRPPGKQLACVIDRSGSMSGAPLRQAIEAVCAMATNLTRQDAVAVIAFDDKVDVLLPHHKCSDHNDIKTSLAGLDARGCTDLHAGWLEGGSQLADHVSHDQISRILLLSDGNANQGLTDTAKIVAQVSRLADAGVTTSTYGLGCDFNEELMIEMAKAGGGKAYYGETAADLMTPFRTEFDLLSALVFRNVRLALKPAKGVTLTVRNKYNRQSNGEYALPDVAYEGESWVLITAELDKPIPPGEACSLFEYAVNSSGMDGQTYASGPVGFALPLMSKREYDALEISKSLSDRIQEIEASDLQEKAEKAAHDCDWDTVDALLEEASIKAKDNPWLEGISGQLKTLAARRDRRAFTKETSYARRRLRSRSRWAHDDGANEGPEYFRPQEAQGCQ